MEHATLPEYLKRKGKPGENRGRKALDLKSKDNGCQVSEITLLGKAPCSGPVFPGPLFYLCGQREQRSNTATTQ